MNITRMRRFEVGAFNYHYTLTRRVSKEIIITALLARMHMNLPLYERTLCWNIKQ